MPKHQDCNKDMYGNALQCFVNAVLLWLQLHAQSKTRQYP